MSSFPDLDELRLLLDALCDERISPDQVARLEELVLAVPEAEAYYVQYLGMYAELSRRFSNPDDLATKVLRTAGGTRRPIAEKTPAFAVRSPRKIVYALACLAILTVVLVRWAGPWRPNVWNPDRVLVLEDTPQPSPTEELLDENGEALDDTVAMVRSQHSAVWDGAALEDGATLPPGLLRLTRGFAEIEFYSGATVVLEAPTDFEILSSMDAYCWRGKLRANVPPHAQGFTIGTPRLDLIDRGTEFGIQVEGPDATEVHVFEGRVEIYKPGDPGKAAPESELRSGQGLRVAQPEIQKTLASNSEAFLSSDELQLRTQADARQRHREWESLRESRKRDPGLIVYYAFQPEAETDRTIANEAAAKLPGSDGTLVGCQWTSGRWPGKQALDFRQVSDRVRLKIPGDFDALTMAVSVRVDALPNKFNSLFMSDSWDEFEGHWHIDSKGTIELGVQGPSRKNWVHYHAQGQFKPELLGRWTQVAVVYDRVGRQVSQYVNGEMISTLPMDLAVPLRIGDCELGNWNPTTRPHRNPVRFLTGRIDEFLVYSRALSRNEIAQLAGVDQSRANAGQ